MWHNMTIELTQEIGRRITMVTEDTKETTYIFLPLICYAHSFVLVGEK